MTIDEMKAIVLNASRKYSKRQIDVPGNGRGVIRLEKGEGVSEEKLELMCRKVIELERQTDADNKKTTKTKIDNVEDKKTTRDNSKTKNQDKNDNTEDKMRELEHENAMLKDTVGELRQSLLVVQERLANLENKTTTLEKMSERAGRKREDIEDKREKLADKIYGFSILQKRTSTGGRTYYKWYAHRRIDDKQHWVYLGKDSACAEAKIKAWLEENFPALLGENN